MTDATRQRFLPTAGSDPATATAAVFARVDLPGGCRDLLRAVAGLQAGGPAWTGPRRELAAATGCAVDTVTRRTKSCVDAGYLDYEARPGRPGTWAVRAAEVIDRPHAPDRPPSRAPRGGAAAPAPATTAAPAAPPTRGARRTQLREGWASVRRGVVLIVAALLWPRPAAAVAGAPRAGERRGDAFQSFLFADPPATPAPALPTPGAAGAGAAASRPSGTAAAPTAPAPPSARPEPVGIGANALPTPAGRRAVDTPGAGAGGAAPAAPPMGPIPSHEPTPPHPSPPIAPMGGAGSDEVSEGRKRAFTFSRSLTRADLADPAAADRLYLEAAASPLTAVRPDDPGHRERFVACCLSIAGSDCRRPAGVLLASLRGGRSRYAATWLTRGGAEDLERARRTLADLDGPRAAAPGATAAAVGLSLPDLTPRSGTDAAERDRQLTAFRTELLAGVPR